LRKKASVQIELKTQQQAALRLAPKNISAKSIQGAKNEDQFS
jgi:hypothetical protein